MRLLPVLTAIFVAFLLYAVINERDTLRALAGDTASGAPGADAGASQPADDPASVPASVPVSVVVQASLAEIVDSGIVLAGRTEAVRKVDVRAETTGLVISDPIRKGSRLVAGDVMCQLEPGTRSATLAEARARLAEAEANYNAAAKLAERGFQSETATMASAAARESADAAVQAAQKDIERLQIRAPFDGLLETDTAELGSLLQPGSVCGTLISLNPIEVVGYVAELDVDKIALGAPAGARLSSGREVLGTVSFVSRSADPLTRTFRVVVEVPNPDDSIRDGLSAEILIGLDGAKGHLLPQSALTLNDQGALGVRVHEAGVARFYAVDVMRDDPGGMWVSGLPDRTEVTVVGQDFVTDGRAIKPQLRERRA
ncbi:MAG: efflux RND transporter periplasmic adaptor subunit [Pseudomonadota bacterium]